MCFELDRGKVGEARMRPDVVVMPTPGFDHDPGFDTAAKPFDRKTFVAEPAVEAFIGPVLPRFAWIDQRGLDVFACKPLKNGVADELRAVVRAQIARGAVLGDVSQHGPCHKLRTAFAIHGYDELLQ